jgi:quercetin dioxygenase-like cupin family protein
VIQGEAVLVTGGTVLNPVTVSPGETRGSSVTGGSEVILHKGDVVHIPARTPHQLRLEPGHQFAYYVLKIRER